MRWVNSIFFCLLLFNAGGQENFGYKRRLSGVEETWHKIILPDELYEKTSPNLTDLRILGISTKGDTVEAPYFVNTLKGSVENTAVEFKVLNQTHNIHGYYYTFEVPHLSVINAIDLHFKKENFDWKILLEGSENGKDWFTVLTDYRILSIKNDMTNYRFTKLKFPNSKFRYYRLKVKTEEPPEFVSANMYKNLMHEASIRNYKPRKVETYNHQKRKETVMDVSLNNAVPVSQLLLRVKDTFDYLRPVAIQYLTDSFKTENGWIKNYETLSNGTIGSLEDNKLTFNPVVLRNLRIIVKNNDNQPLIFEQVVVNGYENELIARFTQPASYYLFYGNEKIDKPNYDLALFKNKIPKNLRPLAFEQEEKILQTRKSNGPLLVNKTWLWSVMVAMMGLLGWFAFKMLKRAE